MARRQNFSVNKFKVGEISPLGGQTSITIDSGFAFGEDGSGQDVTFYGDTANARAIFDASADEFDFDGIDVHLDDSDELRFGTLAAGDIVMKFSGTAFTMTAASASEAFTIGGTSNTIATTLYGTLTVGEDDTGYDVTLYGATTTAKVQWDESDDRLEFTKSGIEFISCKASAETMKFADDSGAACADLASAVGTLNGAIKVKIGSAVAYLATYAGYTPA